MKTVLNVQDFYKITEDPCSLYIIEEESKLDLSFYYVAMFREGPVVYKMLSPKREKRRGTHFFNYYEEILSGPIFERLEQSIKEFEMKQLFAPQEPDIKCVFNFKHAHDVVESVKAGEIKREAEREERERRRLDPDTDDTFF